MRCTEICPVFAVIGYGKEYTVKELTEEVIKDKIFFGENGGVTLSGGECLTQPRFAIEFAKEMKSKGVGVYVDTCGYVKREIIDRIMPYTDKFLYDIKAIDGELHRRLTGKDNALILDNLSYLAERGAEIEIRYPLVKGYNDGECKKIAEFIKSLNRNIPIKVLRYHDFSRSRYAALQREDTLPKAITTAEDVKNTEEEIKKYGVGIITE